MTTADTSVRPARPGDAPAIGRVQLTGWRAAYAGILPAAVLDGLSAEALAEQWRTATERPPTPRHRVLVALDEDRVVGFAALGPATDADRDPDRDAELYLLLVDPAATGAGHGSRLLQAVADHLREDGFSTAVSWLLAADEGLAGFLIGAGWAPDGSTRDLDVPGHGVRQVRLHTALDGPDDSGETRAP